MKPDRMIVFGLEYMDRGSLESVVSANRVFKCAVYNTNSRCVNCKSERFSALVAGLSQTISPVFSSSFSSSVSNFTHLYAL